MLSQATTCPAGLLLCAWRARTVCICVACKSTSAETWLCAPAQGGALRPHNAAFNLKKVRCKSVRRTLRFGFGRSGQNGPSDTARRTVVACESSKVSAGHGPADVWSLVKAPLHTFPKFQRHTPSRTREIELFPCPLLHYTASYSNPTKSKTRGRRPPTSITYFSKFLAS